MTVKRRLYALAAVALGTLAILIGVALTAKADADAEKKAIATARSDIETLLQLFDTRLLPMLNDENRVADDLKAPDDTIADEVRKLAERTATSTQSTASGDVARGVERIAQMGDENSGALQRTADVAAKLSSVATQLQENARRFRL